MYFLMEISQDGFSTELKNNFRSTAGKFNINWQEFQGFKEMRFADFYGISVIEFSKGSFHFHGLTLVPAWISNYIYYDEHGSAMCGMK